MLPGGQELPAAEVQRHLRDGECNEAQAHQDGAHDADKEREVVPSAYALVQPLTMVVKHVDTLVTHGAVLGPHGGDVDVAEVTPGLLLQGNI